MSSSKSRDHQAELKKSFVEIALPQMKTLTIKKKEKMYIAEELLKELQTSMTTDEIARVLDSKAIKWNKIVDRYPHE